MHRIKLAIPLGVYLFLLPLFSHAADLKPWFGNDYDAEIHFSTLYQNYKGVEAPHHRYSKRNENDVFFNFSLEYPYQRYCGEFEAILAHTRHQNCRWDNFQFTGRYKWLDDNEGDPVSLVIGLTFIEPFSRALHDISSFHHGHIEGEINLSFGKQYGSCLNEDWVYRWWNVVSFGVADVGSPWMWEDVAFEHNLYSVHRIRYFLHSLWGFGKNNLSEKHFKGYGSIQHRSVDLGIRYSYNLGCRGSLSIQYARRVYAHNFPDNANLVLFEYNLPFGTQYNSNY